MAEKRKTTTAPCNPKMNYLVAPPPKRARLVEPVGDTVCRLPYAVYRWSSYSANYHPRNILENNPNDQSSRWMSASTIPPQFVMLKLTTPAILKTIRFGKYEKSHVCNLRQVKVLAGMDEEQMLQVFEGYLRNDSVEETFTLQCQVNEHTLPSQFVKIVPLMAHDRKFNYALWYVELHGIRSDHIVQPAVLNLQQHLNDQAMRLCLKFLREHNHLNVLEQLKLQSSAALEGTLLTKLHRLLVEEEKFSEAEVFVTKAVKDGFFDEYVVNQEVTPEWTRIHPVATVGENSAYDLSWPTGRGGHDMCFDSEKGLLYLFGGWDGLQNLADLWLFDVKKQHWECLSKDTTREGGPSRRSCHRMCFDHKFRKLYVLGRYLKTKTKSVPENDFFCYDCDSGVWMKLSEDTARQGGPSLLSDHQMCIDPEEQMLYVFGGRVTATSSYSGLFCYDIASQVWRKLREDCGVRPSRSDELPSRIGHAMVFHPEERKLYIFAGMRTDGDHDCHFRTLHSYDIQTDQVQLLSDSEATLGYDEVSDDSSRLVIYPEGGTQRAVLDVDVGELYVLPGTSSDVTYQLEKPRNYFWIYSLRQRTWKCVFRNESQSLLDIQKEVVPRTRFAHQLVYDSRNKVQYLFGGNPGCPFERLDDLWSFRLLRRSREQLLHECVLKLRFARFLHIAVADSVEALHYLQNDLANIVDQSKPKERDELTRAAVSLFTVSGKSTLQSFGLEQAEEKRLFCLRSETFALIAGFFPESMSQPRRSLEQLLPLNI